MASQPIIGDWHFDVDGGALTQPGCVRRLEDRAARTLALLCERRGEVVSKADILDEVWNGRSVSANSVAIVIADLRRAVGEDARSPQHIETVGKRGYRLSPGSQDDPRPIDAAPPKRVRGLLSLIGGIAFVAAILLAVVSTTWISAPPVILVLSPVRNETGETRYDPLAKALAALVEERMATIPGLAVTETGSPSPNRRARRRLEMKARLIIWNETPTLSLSAVDLSDGRVVWDGMAVGQPNTIARAAITQLDNFKRHL